MKIKLSPLLFPARPCVMVRPSQQVNWRSFHGQTTRVLVCSMDGLASHVFFLN
jgi:hypothetical protein